MVMLTCLVLDAEINFQLYHHCQSVENKYITAGAYPVNTGTIHKIWQINLVL